MRTSTDFKTSTRVKDRTMADLQTSSNPQIALVLQALEDLVLRFDEHVQQQEGEKKIELTQEDRDYKTQLLDELHWNLLPAIQKQLSCLSTSLDLLHDPEKFPTPNFEPTGEILSHLAEAMFASLDCVESAALDINLGPQDRHPTYAYGLRRLDRILAAINSNSDNAAYRTAASRSGAYLLKKMNECTQLASNIIRWTHASDFEVIQDEWEEQAESLSPTIEVLTNITQSTKAHRNNITPLRQHVIKLAKSSALLIKLSQIYRKLSRRNCCSLWIHQLNSETLDDLHDRPGTIAYRFECHARTLSDSYEHDALLGAKLRYENESRVSHSRSTPLCSFTPGINYASLDTNFKAWLLEWQKSWHTATVGYKRHTTKQHTRLYLKRCKSFRSFQMMCKITEVVSIHLRSLVRGSIQFMRASKVSTNYSETTECQYQHTRLLRDSATCSVLTRQAIDWLQGSDFRIIQDEWQDKQLGDRVHCISRILQSTLLILALHLIPLHTTNINHQSPDNDYKAWFAVWQATWYRAIHNFLTTLQLEGQQAQQPLAPA
ncbi:hypothetical protein PSTT_12027 [Puccinia striiformis]|uniref:Uncharacterized protein n=1 Tax=Puccinia striiformis TaxID=27350 RepID=A0A2S4UYE4_9BASI|nr:hypothetical protein PSTT_12027 [Puccinia striiformis]